MGTIEAVEIQRFDPLMREVAMPRTALFHPVGFPLRLTTNSSDVIEAGAESWDEWPPEFDTPPIEMRVLVEPEGHLAGPPRFRMQGHLIQAVGDAHNFAVADTRALFASICVSARTAADHSVLRWFYLESLGYLLLAQRYLTAIHAACVARNGSGILLCGVSTAGKSTLAFACARAGFTYVSDDCVWLLNGAAERVALGRPHHIRFRQDASRHFPELEGQLARARPNGKIAIELSTRALPHIATARRAPIGAIVFLVRDSQGEARLDAMAPEEALTLLLRDLPSYGEETNAIQQATVEKAVGAPAFRLHYQSLEDGVSLLCELS